MVSVKGFVDKCWFASFLLYVLCSYLAQDVLLPSSIGSLTLYLFLALSIVAIFLSSKVKFNAFVKWEILFLVVSFFAMLITGNVAILSGTYYSLIVNFVLVFFLSQMNMTRTRFNIILTTYAISSGALIALLYFTGNLEDSAADGRLGGDLFGNANILAMLLMCGAIYGIWLFLSLKSATKRMILIFAISITYLGMFLSGGRKYIVVPLIFAYIALLGKTNKRGKRHIILYTLVACSVLFLVYLLIMNIPAFYDTIGHRFEGAFAIFDDSYAMDGSTKIRLEMIQIGFDKWLEKPLFGYGFDSFKYYNVTVTGKEYYSHNNFVELLYNQGILGFVVYYGFYAYLLYRAWKTKASAAYKGRFFGLMLSILFFEYFAVTYSASHIQFALLFMFMSLELAEPKEKNDMTIKENERVEIKNRTALAKK